ncbi:MAG: bacteriophage holin [Candidatus Saelkia tenebricola]|nr:bacteriophage holin [Candidatus Saelkia tenebricola]
MTNLNVKALGLSLGIIWAIAAFIMGILAMMLGYGGNFVEALGSIYIGYEATLKGSIIGAIWGFIDAGICGVIVAWLYNKLAK